jgi:uncharacterized protein
MTALGFPWTIGDGGRIAGVDRERQVRDLIELVLFTTPGERVNRPTFGSGLLQAVFGPSSAELAATAQVLAQSSLQQWLGDLIEVETTTIDADDAKLVVTVQYVIRGTQQRQSAVFVRGGTP